jgi:hypothetical protein
MHVSHPFSACYISSFFYHPNIYERINYTASQSQVSYGHFFLSLSLGISYAEYMRSLFSKYDM